MSARPKLKRLEPRKLGQLAPSRVPVLGAAGWRTSNMTTAQLGYGGRWQRERIEYLRLNPLCVMCKGERPPRVTPATVVDHKIPHRGDQALFWDRTNWQSLCKRHHDSDAQKRDRAHLAGRANLTGG